MEILWITQLTLDCFRLLPVGYESDFDVTESTLQSCSFTKEQVKIDAQQLQVLTEESAGPPLRAPFHTTCVCTQLQCSARIVLSQYIHFV